MKDFLLVFFLFFFLPEVQFQWLQQSQGMQITRWEKKNISQLALTTVTSSLRTLKHRFNESDLQKKNIWLSCLFLSSCSSSVKWSSDHFKGCCGDAVTDSDSWPPYRLLAMLPTEETKPAQTPFMSLWILEKPFSQRTGMSRTAVISLQRSSVFNLSWL